MDELLLMLKIDLGITTTAYDSRLTQYLRSAQAEIEREGAAICPARLDDAMLVVMYAAWQWRRRDTGEGMPRMLRYALNQHVLSQKARGGSSDDGQRS